MFTVRGPEGEWRNMKKKKKNRDTDVHIQH